MTVVELHEYFDILLDKMGDPYFNDEEKDTFLTMAQLEYVKRELPSNEGGDVNIEATQLDYNNVSTLVYDISSMAMNSSGNIPFTTVQTKLDTASSDTKPFMFILNVSATTSGNTYPVRYTRQNDWFEFERNSLKRGTTSEPRYKTNSINLTFSPINTSSSIAMSLLKTPKDIRLQGNITSELPAHTHKTLVELAIELASVAVREAELTQLNAQQENR